MTTVQSLLLADGHGEKAVHFQQIDSGPAIGRYSEHSIAAPCKVLVPRLIARVKQKGFNSGKWIIRAAACAFAEGARNAGESQVFQLGFSARYDRNDVVHMKRRFLAFLRQTAVFAAIVSAQDNLGP